MATGAPQGSHTKAPSVQQVAAHTALTLARSNSLNMGARVQLNGAGIASGGMANGQNGMGPGGGMYRGGMKGGANQQQGGGVGGPPIPPSTVGGPTYIQPSHPHHPQHTAWLRQQQQQQQQQLNPPNPSPRAQPLRLNPAYPSSPGESPVNGRNASPRAPPNLQHRPLSGIPRPYPPPPLHTSNTPQPGTAVGTLGIPPTNGSNPATRSQVTGVTLATLAANLAISGTGPITASASAVGPALAKLSAFNESMALAFEEHNIDALRAVVSEYFTDTGMLRFGVYDKTGYSMPKVFEIPCSAFPRFQHINGICGVLQSIIHPSLVREYFLTTSDPATGRPIHVGYLLKANRAVWTSNFDTGNKVDLVGSLTVHFVVTMAPGGGGGAGGLKVESIDFDSRGHEEFIARHSILVEKVEKLYDVNGRGSEESSPVLGSNSKVKGGKKATTRRRSLTKEDDDFRMDEDNKCGTERVSGLGAVSFEKNVLPISPVGAFGITEMGMRCLEIAESVAQLQDLIGYSLDSNTSPIQSLIRFAEARSRVAIETQQVSVQNLPTPQANTYYATPSTRPSSIESTSALANGMTMQGPSSPPNSGDSMAHQQQQQQQQRQQQQQQQQISYQQQQQQQHHQQQQQQLQQHQIQQQNGLSTSVNGDFRMKRKSPDSEPIAQLVRPDIDVGMPGNYVAVGGGGGGSGGVNGHAPIKSGKIPRGANTRGRGRGRGRDSVD